jgi:hypothetical protein
MWAACAALLLTKASYVFVGPLFACGLAVERRHRDGGSWLSAGILEALCHGIPFLAMIAAWAAVNTVKFGQPWLTGYHVWRPSDHSLTGDLRESLPALLGSVQRGFVFCFPVLVIALPFMRRWLRTRPVAYGGIVAVFLVYVGLIGMLPSWTGEWCYGPRYWLFILPFVSMPAVDALEWLRRGGPAALGFAAITVAGLGYSTWLQVQVNRFPFFAYYQLMIPVREFSSPSLDAFFLGQSYGWIEYSMWRNRHALDKLPWWHEIERSDDSTFPLRYERHVRRQLNRGNSFLFPPHAD